MRKQDVRTGVRAMALSLDAFTSPYDVRFNLRYFVFDFRYTHDRVGPENLFAFSQKPRFKAEKIPS